MKTLVGILAGGALIFLTGGCAEVENASLAEESTKKTFDMTKGISRPSEDDYDRAVEIANNPLKVYEEKEEQEQSPPPEEKRGFARYLLTDEEQGEEHLLKKLKRDVESVNALPEIVEEGYVAEYGSNLRLAIFWAKDEKKAVLLSEGRKYFEEINSIWGRKGKEVVILQGNARSETFRNYFLRTRVEELFLFGMRVPDYQEEFLRARWSENNLFFKPVELRGRLREKQWRDHRWTLREEDLCKSYWQGAEYFDYENRKVATIEAIRFWERKNLPVSVREDLAYARRSAYSFEKKGTIVIFDFKKEARESIVQYLKRVGPEGLSYKGEKIWSIRR